MTEESCDTPSAALTTGPLVGRRLKPIGLDNDYTCESVGSWLLRTARLNGFGNLTSLLQKTGFYNIHLDIPSRPESFISAVSAATGRAKGEVQRMLLGKCGVDARRDISVRPWVLSAREQRLQQHDGMRHVICPQCLHEDAEPYWRKYWRFSFSTACRVHGTLLDEVCNHCRHYFVIDAHSINDPRYCATCDQPLARPDTDDRRFAHGPVEKMLSRVFVEGGTAALLKEDAGAHQRLNFSRLVDFLCSPTGQAFRKGHGTVDWLPESSFKGGLMTFYPRALVWERRCTMDFLESLAERSPVIFWQLLNFKATVSPWFSLAKLLLHAPAPMRWGKPQEVGSVVDRWDDGGTGT